MSNIDPKILELAKREYGENCELVKRTEWSYSFKCGPKSYCSISRFMVEKDFAVSASEIPQRWPAMDERERADFASNWWTKGTWTDDDSEILEIIMADGDDRVWQCCTEAFLMWREPRVTCSFPPPLPRRNGLSCNQSAAAKSCPQRAGRGLHGELHTGQLGCGIRFGAGVKTCDIHRVRFSRPKHAYGLQSQNKINSARWAALTRKPMVADYERPRKVS